MAECGINTKIASYINSIATSIVLSALPLFAGIRSRRRVSKALSNLIANILNGVNQTSSSSSSDEFEIIEQDEHSDCVICLCKVCKNEKYRRLPGCSHGFHAECIEAWLKDRSTCPLCRSPVSSSTAAGLNKQSRFQCLLNSFLISGIISFLNHVYTWILNPLSFDLTDSESD